MAEKRARMKRPAPVSDLMAALFRGKPAGQRLEEGKIWLVWDAAVGKQIAAKASPASFRDGILTVTVSNAPWMQQLTFLKKGMIEKLNKRLGRELVRDIYLKAGRPAVSPVTSKQSQHRNRPLLPAERELIEAQTESMGDPDLREIFRNLLILHKTSPKYDEE